MAKLKRKPFFPRDSKNSQDKEVRQPAFFCDSIDLLIALCTSCITMLVYLKTLAPTVTGEDSGELIAAAYCLGIPHPPGYPLWTLLGRLFALLPIGEVAFRLNLMSAFFASITVFLLFLIAKKITGSRAASFAASLIFGFSRTFWSQAVITEVYTFNAFFLALLLFFLITWSNAKDTKDTKKPLFLYLALALFSLSLTNHYPLMLIALPGLFLYVLFGLHDKKLHKFQSLKKALLSHKAIPGLLFALVLVIIPCAFFYLHEMYRSKNNPLLNWGNPDTSARLLYHMCRIEYKSLDFGRSFSLPDSISFTLNFCHQLLLQFTPFLIPVALIGALVLLNRRKSIAISLSVIFLLNSLGLILTLRFPFERENIMRVTPYYIPSYLVASLFIAAGLSWILSRIIEKFKKEANKAMQLKSPPLVVSVTFALLFLLLPALPLCANYTFNNLSGNHISYDYASVLLNDLPPDAILFPSGDNNTFPIVYLQVVEKLRPDVLNANITGELSPEAFRIYSDLPGAKKQATKREIEEALITSLNRPVFYLFRGDIPRIPGYVIHPEGLAYRLCRMDESTGGKTHIALRSITLRGGEKVLPSHSDMDLSLMASLCQMRGEAFLLEGKYEEALREFRRGADIASHLAEWLNNLGSTCAEAGFSDLAEEFYRRSLKAYPRYRTASLNLAKLLQSERNFDAALTQLNTHLSLNFDDQEAGVLKGDIEQFIMSSDRLISDLKQQALKDPIDKTLHNDLGTTYAQRGWYDLAKEEYQKALDIDPFYELARRNLENIALEESKREKASLIPTHDEAR